MGVLGRRRRRRRRRKLQSIQIHFYQLIVGNIHAIFRGTT
jgi:hypothetical protein